MVSRVPSASESVDPPVGIPVEYPSYAPDGRQISFNTRWPGKNEIFAVSTVDDRVRTLVPELVSRSVAGSITYSARHSAWSPDGKWIAFVSDRPERAFLPPQPSIWLVRSDGSGLTQLRTRGLTIAGEPTWSPDGKQIAFTSVADIRSGVVYTDTRDIWVINVDGSGLRRVTNLSWLPNLQQSAYHPSFSPDGQQIVFSQGSSGEEMGECVVGNKLVVINADGTGARQLTTGDAQDFHSHPSWSRRGILFASSRCSSPAKIMMIQSNGTGLHAIPGAAGWGPTWSPDNSKFVFVRAGDYVHNVSGYGLYEFDFSSRIIRALVQIRGFFINIDIMPGTSPKTISLKETTLIRVAIPRHAGFGRVQEIDRAAITFGRTGEERSLASCAQDGVNLVCHFKTALTGFRSGDRQGILRLVTVSSTPGSTSRVRYEGRGTVQVVP